MEKTYKYMGALAQVGEKLNDVDYFINDSAPRSSGRPRPVSSRSSGSGKRAPTKFCSGSTAFPTTRS